LVQWIIYHLYITILYLSQLLCYLSFIW